MVHAAISWDLVPTISLNKLIEGTNKLIDSPNRFEEGYNKLKGGFHKSNDSFHNLIVRSRKSISDVP
jgi:hypothetical protein